MRSQYLVSARREVERAARVWPTQQSYVWARAVLAARLSDTASVEAALRDYATLGLGRELRDTAFDRFRLLPWFADVERLHAANRAPLVKSRVRATLADSTSWPEGVDYDARTRRFYVASVRHRTIIEVAPDGAQRELWPRGQAGMGAIMGVRVDPRGDVLWATTSALPQMAGYQPADSAIAALLQVRIRDGAILRRWDLVDKSRHVLGDLAIGPDGDVLMTDSESPVLYRLRPGADTLEAMTHPLFRSLQGIAPSPDVNTLFVADYSHGMLRVDLRDRTATRVADAPASTSLGCDGIAWYRGSIIAVQNGVAPARVVRFYLDASGTRFTRAEVIDRNVAVADEPTIGTIAGNEFVYVANSQWEKYAENGKRNAVPLTRPVLLSVPLSP
jgi:sugar lactone lactonase YvrE